MARFRLDRTALALVALVVLPVLLAGCVGTGSGRGATRGSESPWLEPSPKLRMEIEEKANELPWSHGLDRIEIIRWFASVGEPAYPWLLGMATDPRPEVAGAALAALGATQDSRLVEPLRALPWPPEDRKDLRLERARALLRLGDWSLIPHLIGGLEEDQLLTRALCLQALAEATGERFGYDPKAPEKERAEAVRRWREWWAARQADPLLPRED